MTKLFDTATEDKLLGYYIRFPRLLRNPVPEDYFHQSTHRLAYRNLQLLSQKADNLDIHLLLDFLKGREEEVGGAETLIRAYSSAGEDPEHAAVFVDRLKGFRTARMLTTLSASISDAISQDTDHEQVISQVERILSQIRQTSGNRNIYDSNQLADMFTEYLQEAVDGKRKLRGIRTLLDHRIDELLTTLHPGALFVLAARPSVGKTTVGLEIGRKLATGEHSSDTLLDELLAEQLGRELQQPVKTGFISREMGWRELMPKLVGAATEAGLTPFAQDNFPGWAFEDIKKYLESFRNLPFILDDLPELGMRSVLDSIAYMAQQGCKVIIVDYLQLLRYDLADARSSDNEQVEVSKISKSLKGAARQHGVLVIALSQLNRPQGERAEITRPSLKSLRGSGAIEQDADIVAFLWSDQKDYRQQTRAKLIFTLEKQRGGRIDEIPLLFDKGRPSFSPWTGEHNPDEIENESPEAA
ncbi:hypothetical protein IHN63_00375 [Deinococcus sp. 6YEL10]|uniref:replicative DNA helicase n=1 Tax=Deinococcus sp. 6YEL10 TaxID=2745870 RepID=UPI001E375525|nr:DnaB-like helicase C-terminal domain-containing protein [Deinococcus sp. 6YEL10]MCD0159754.1 hypothetical protein [Deinococcus sp. 6YEL10]